MIMVMINETKGTLKHGERKTWAGDETQNIMEPSIPPTPTELILNPSEIYLKICFERKYGGVASLT